MAILAFLALTTVAAFASYLAGYKAGEREQIRRSWSSLEMIRRPEDEGALTYDEYLASVLGACYPRRT